MIFLLHAIYHDVLLWSGPLEISDFFQPSLLYGFVLPTFDVNVRGKRMNEWNEWMKNWVNEDKTVRTSGALYSCDHQWIMFYLRQTDMYFYFPSINIVTLISCERNLSFHEKIFEFINVDKLIIYCLKIMHKKFTAYDHFNYILLHTII